MYLCNFRVPQGRLARTPPALGGRPFLPPFDPSSVSRNLRPAACWSSPALSLVSRMPSPAGSPLVFLPSDLRILPHLDFQSFLFRDPPLEMRKGSREWRWPPAIPACVLFLFYPVKLLRRKLGSLVSLPVPWDALVSLAPMVMSGLALRSAAMYLLAWMEGSPIFRTGPRHVARPIKALVTTHVARHIRSFTNCSLRLFK